MEVARARLCVTRIRRVALLSGCPCRAAMGSCARETNPCAVAPFLLPRCSCAGGGRGLGDGGR